MNNKAVRIFPGSLIQYIILTCDLTLVNLQSQKRASSLTRIVQALSISGSEEKTPNKTPKGSFSKSKRKAKGMNYC